MPKVTRFFFTALMSIGLVGLHVNCGKGGDNSSSSNVAPSITTQPADRTVSSGTRATFTVVASGTPAPTYQWKVGGNDIQGATSATYLTPATDSSMNGNIYTCTVTNAAGSVTSNQARLTVQAATMTITDASGRSSVGHDLIYPLYSTFTIRANPSVSVQPNSYKWYFRSDTNPEWTEEAGYTTDTFTWPLGADAGENGYYYATALDNNGNTIVSNQAHVVIEIAVLTPSTAGAGQFTMTISSDSTQGSTPASYYWFTGQSSTDVDVLPSPISGDPRTFNLTDSGFYFVIRLDNNGERVRSHPILIPSSLADERGISIIQAGANLVIGGDYTGRTEEDSTPYTWYRTVPPAAPAPIGTGSSIPTAGPGEYYVTRTNFAGIVMRSNAITVP